MAKRGADTYITSETVSSGSDSEEQQGGEFKKADEATLKERKISLAKRRNPDAAAASGEVKPPAAKAFAGFSGFGTAPKPGDAPKPAFAGFGVKKADDAPKTDAPSFPGFGTKAPAAESAKDMPKLPAFGAAKAADTPKADAPKTEAPKFGGFGAAKVPAPGADAAKADAPKFPGFGVKVDAPKTDSPKTEAPKFGGFGAAKVPEAAEKKEAPKLGGFGAAPAVAPAKPAEIKSTAPAPAPAAGTKSLSLEQAATLNKLNSDFFAWVKTQVEGKDVVDLSPGLQDYLREAKAILSTSTPTPTSAAPPAPAAKAPTPTTAAASVLPKLASPVAAAAPKLSFPAPASAATAAPKLAFPAPAAGGTVMPPLKFGNMPIGFPKPAAKKGEDEDGEEDGEGGEEGAEEEPEPPKKIASEDPDSLYSVRSKLFFQKAGDKGAKEWAERGVGLLALKDDGGKTRVLMRGDDSCSTIYLNVFLNKATSAISSGKNAIIFSAIPNPPVQPTCSVCSAPLDNPRENACKNGCHTPDGCQLAEKKGQKIGPTQYLIRVKTDAARDELLAAINKHKA